MRKKIFSIFALGALLLTASCSLHDDNEIFDTPAAQRMEETIANDKALLESATNGWELHLWLGEEYSAGGQIYLMKFANDKVTVASDIADPTSTSTSSYGIVSDEGPVLTVNTYNDIFHDLANPQSDGSEVGQDYELIITRTTNDSIYLTGKKYGNKMVMTRIPESVVWSEHLQAIQNEEDNMMANFNILNGSDSVGTAVITDRMATIVTDSGEVSIPYIVTETGVEFQRPFVVNGINVQNLTYNDESSSFTSPDKGAEAVNLQVTFPENYMFYDDFVGRWRLYYYYGLYSQYVTLTPNGDNKTYTMSGFNGFTVQVQYHKPSGGIRIYAQQVATTSAGNYIYMITTDGSYIYWSLSNGFGATRNMNYPSQYRLSFTDLTDAGVNGFYLAEFTGAPSSSTYVGASSTVTFTGTSIIMQNINRMVKQ